MMQAQASIMMNLYKNLLMCNKNSLETCISESKERVALKNISRIYPHQSALNKSQTLAAVVKVT